MDTRGWALLGAATLSAIVAATSVNSQVRSTSQERVKDGQLVEGSRRAPTSGDVVVYELPTRTGFLGFCPVYGSRLAQDQADSATGTFRLEFPAAVKEITVTFCRSGYYPRTETQAAAAGAGLLVAHPVQIFPRNGSPEAYRETVGRALDQLVSENEYLREICPEEYESALSAWRETSDERYRRLADVLLDAQLRRQ